MVFRFRRRSRSTIQITLGGNHMNKHERVLEIIRSKNKTPINLDPSRTALIVVDMQRYFTQPSYPFTQVFDVLSPEVTADYLQPVREVVIPSIQPNSRL